MENPKILSESRVKARKLHTRPIRTIPDASATINFDGHLPSALRGSLVKETLKYLIYVRNQIPTPVDILAGDKRADEERGALETINKAATSARRPKLTLRRRDAFLARLGVVFDFIDDAFAAAEFVPEVALVLGSTLVSPKESFLLSFPAPTSRSAASAIGNAKAMRKFLSFVVAQDFASKLQDISKLSSKFPTILHVALKAPRSASLNPGLSAPFLAGLSRLRRGAIVSLDVESAQNGNDETESDRRLSLSASCVSCRISGVEPHVDADLPQGFRRTLVDDPFHISEEFCEKLCLDEGFGLNVNRKVGAEFTLDSLESFDPVQREKSRLEKEGDYIWYLCTQSVKGFKLNHT